MNQSVFKKYYKSIIIVHVTFFWKSFSITKYKSILATDKAKLKGDNQFGQH